jgi:excisionase family DNA binding protein
VNLIEQLEARSGAMKVGELCELLGVDDKHIYRMAARGLLPSFHVGGAVRFDPKESPNGCAEGMAWFPVMARDPQHQLGPPEYRRGA